MDTTTIRIYATTKARLDDIGKKTDTYDMILNRLLDVHKGAK